MTVNERARIHAALGDPHRLEIVERLALNDMTPHEIAMLIGLESNLVAHHLNVLDEAGLIERQPSLGDRRRRYVVLQRQVLGALWQTPDLRTGSVLFLCTHNSARSQFAEALMRQRSDVHTQSAGMNPAKSIHPKARKVAQEAGLDLAGQAPKPYSSVQGSPDLVITVCDRACESEIPFAGERLHWSIPDPVDTRSIDGFREALEEIDERVEELVRLTDAERKST